VRLNRYLAAAGLGSRRACEALITEGRVTLNGQPCAVLATAVGPKDAVKVDGRLVHAERATYVLLNKPAGYLSTRTDPRQRRTVFDLLPADFPRVFHVGRLDQDSEGLLLLTNDGELALRLTHPRYKVDKEYEVLLDRPFDMTLADKLRAGIFIPVEMENGQPPRRVRARAEALYRINPHTLKVILRQGLKRQIRLMFSELGYNVRRLQRTRLGTLQLGPLKAGEWRFLDPREVAALLKPAAAAPPPERRSAKKNPLGPRVRQEFPIK
jgi:23S rRNA pseudouridine2605 synthase